SSGLQSDRFHFGTYRRQAITLRAVKRSLDRYSYVVADIRAAVDDSEQDVRRAIWVQHDQRRKRAQKSALAGGKSHAIPDVKIEARERSLPDFFSHRDLWFVVEF